MKQTVGIIALILVVIVATLGIQHVLVVKPMSEQVQQASVGARVAQLERDVKTIANVLAQVKIADVPRHLQIHSQAVQQLAKDMKDAQKRLGVLEPDEPTPESKEDLDEAPEGDESQ